MLVGEDRTSSHRRRLSVRLQSVLSPPSVHLQSRDHGRSKNLSCDATKQDNPPQSGSSNEGRRTVCVAPVAAGALVTSFLVLSCTAHYAPRPRSRHFALIASAIDGLWSLPPSTHPVTQSPTHPTVPTNTSLLRLSAPGLGTREIHLANEAFDTKQPPRSSHANRTSALALQSRPGAKAKDKRRRRSRSIAKLVASITSP